MQNGRRRGRKGADWRTIDIGYGVNRTRAATRALLWMTKFNSKPGKTNELGGQGNNKQQKERIGIMQKQIEIAVGMGEYSTS